MPPFATRRAFLALGSGLAAHTLLRAQSAPITHANVGDLDRDTILRQASSALGLPVQAPPSTIFHSETIAATPEPGNAGRPDRSRPDADALRTFSNTVAALAAAFLVTRDASFAQRAVQHLTPWLVAPNTRLQPTFDQAGCAPGSSSATPAGVVDLVPLAELARALSFLTDVLAPDALEAVQAWCADALRWLSSNRQARIAMDTNDHRASAHLLVSAALARFVRDDKTLEDCRKRFRTQTLRHQIRADGVFPQEVTTPNPYRNTLFNFDLLAGACQLLNSPFDLLWEFQLIDEVGLRAVAAYLYPVIAHPERWGYPADATHFRDLPGRRPGLLFAGRAYNRPEYVDSWRQAPSTPPAQELAYSFPIRQPALWTARAPHGL